MENLAVARLSPKFLPVQTASYGDDSGAHAVFDEVFIKNEYQSEIQAKVVGEWKYQVTLQWPGDNTKTAVHTFSLEEGNKGNQWTERFPKQWAAFKNAMEQVPDGTPIEMWPPLDKRRVFELKSNKIFTVEQIAALTDATGPSLGLDWRKIRDHAKSFLNPDVSHKQVATLTRENEDLRLQMESMQAQIIALSQGQPLPKKRGPKPKLVE